MARYDDLNTGAIAYTTFVGSVLLLIIILLGRALCYSLVESEDERKLADARYTASDNEISEQLSILADYKKEQVEVAPAEEGSDTPPTTEEKLIIPIDDAKAIILKELGDLPTT